MFSSSLNDDTQIDIDRVFMICRSLKVCYPVCSFLEAFPTFQGKCFCYLQFSEWERRHWKNNSPFRVLTVHSLFFPSIPKHLVLTFSRPRAYPLKFDFSTKQTKTKLVSCPGLGKKYLIAEVFVCWEDSRQSRLSWTHSYVFCSTISSIVACAWSSGHTNVLWFSESTCLCTHWFQFPLLY